MAEIAESTSTAQTRTLSDRLSLPALVASTGISALGNGLTLLAVPWFVLVTTGSAARTGLAGAATAVAMVIAGVLGGTLVDRLGFKRASIVSDIASGVTVALIPTLYFLDVLSFWMLIALVFLGAVLDAPGASARRAMIPGLVKQAGSTLERANSAMQFAQLTTGDFIAPLLAGVLIGIIGAASVLYLNAATFAISVLIVAFAIRIPARFEESAGVAEGQESGSGSYFSELAEGFRYVIRDSFLSVVIPISVAANFLFSPLFFVALPVLANTVLGGPGSFGLMVAGFGAGAGVGTIVYGAVGHRVRRYSMYWIAISGASVGLWILTAATNLGIATLATVVVGLAIGPVNALGMVLIQTRVPERMMGRVIGLLFAFSGLATPLGILFGGLVVESSGVRAILVISALGMTACALWVRLSPALRALADELEDRPGLSS